MATPSFIKQKKDVVFFNGDGEFLLFVPEVFFDRNLATINGEYVELLGILNYSTIKKETDDVTKNLKRFYFPSMFVTKPGRIEVRKNFQLTKNYVEDFRVFHYADNGIDEIISSTRPPQNIDYVNDFFRLFVMTGNIPKSIPYEDIYKYFIDSMAVNGFSYNLSMSLFGMIVSELCRDPKDINKPFRLSSAIDTDPCSYNSISIKTIPKLVSAFSSLTSENFDEAVVGAIMNDKVSSSPMERVLMG